MAFTYLIYLVWEFWEQNRTTFLSDNRYFEIQAEINVNSIKRYLMPFVQLFRLVCNQCTEHVLKQRLHALVVANRLQTSPSFPWHKGTGDASY